MSRANVPPVKVTSIIESSPYEPVIGVNDDNIVFEMVYSGFEADSVAPAGEMVISVVPSPSKSQRVASTEDAP